MRSGTRIGTTVRGADSTLGQIQITQSAGVSAEGGSTLSLMDIYQQMRAGALSVATADGQWAFGLALVKAGITDLLPPA